MHAPLAPPRWTAAQFDSRRKESIKLFRDQRLAEPLEEYLEAFDKYRGVVEEVLEATVDLAQLHAKALDILTKPEMLEVFRYLPGPPISADDLKTVTEAESIAPGRLKKDAALVKKIIDTVFQVIDQRRFPWIVDGREATEAERAAAVIASAALLATQRIGTQRRNESKVEQEGKVSEALEALGFKKIPTRPMPTLSDAPAPGEFCSETTLGKEKADLVVGLWDKRTMPVECKTSNSSVNSLKRLNRDAAAKAEAWNRDLGLTQVVPTAVISGVFALEHLERAQGRGLTIFWGHRLDEMTDWIAKTKP